MTTEPRININDVVSVRDLPAKPAGVADWLIGVPSNQGGPPFRAPFEQLPVQPAVQQQIDALAAGQQAGQLVYRTWAELSAVTGSVGEGAQVISDAGTHTDPVVGGTVSNAGQYVWSESPAGWRWVRPDALPLKADKTDLQQLEETLAPQLGVDSVGRIPLFVDAAGSVPLWLENGGVAFSEVGSSGRQAISNFLTPLGGIPDPIDLDGAYVPLFRDNDGSVPLWLENGGIAVSKFGPSFVTRLRSHVQSRQYGYAYSTPVATDGRTLYRYRSKLARKAVGEAVKPRIMLMGDSWMDLPALPQGIANHLYAMHGRGGEGWITNGESNYMNGITRTTVGAWTLYDASTGATPLYGTGVNGQSRSTTANDARTLINDVLCTDFTIYYQDLDGTFQYGVYAGGSVATWNTVVCEGTGTTKAVTISGLEDGQHTFEVRTNGNTGRVVIHGFEANRAGTSGIIIDKAGNSGSTSTNLMDYLPYVQQYLTAMQPDVIVLALGTNDSSVEFDTGKFRAHLPAMINAWRAAIPDVGIVLIVPARVNGVKRSALIDYRDAIYEIALDMGTEFYSLYDDWSDSATMHALNMFDDDVHPNNAGSAFIARRLASLMEL